MRIARVEIICDHCRMTRIIAEIPFKDGDPTVEQQMIDKGWTPGVTRDLCAVCLVKLPGTVNDPPEKGWVDTR